MKHPHSTRRNAVAHALRWLLCCFASWLLCSTAGAAPHALTGSQPADGARGVSLEASIELRFNADVPAADRLVATLVGSAGVAPVLTERSGPRALRVRPTAQLQPDATYTLVVKAKTAAAETAPLAILGFRTRALEAQAPSARSKAPAEDDAPDERFTPTPAHRAGQWKTGVRHLHSRDAHTAALAQQSLLDALPAPARARLRSRMQETGEYVPLAATRIPSAAAAARVAGAARGSSSTSTTLSGQVLRLNGKPLPGVRLAIGGRSVQTGKDGEFVLRSVPSGTQVLLIDGRQAGERASDFGRYEYRVELKPGVNELPHTIWLTRIDHRNATKIASPTRQETVVTHPDIPGLELRIPAGTVIRDAQGRIVDEISITPIPVDQPPFPLPNQDVPVYYSIQPGGAHIETVNGGPPTGARLIYPNFAHELPGARADFWNYDASGYGWFVYGSGTVNADATQVIPDPEVQLWAFSGAMISGGGGAPSGPPPGSSGGPGSGGPGSGGPGGSGGGGGPGGSPGGDGPGGDGGGGGDGPGGDGPGGDGGGDGPGGGGGNNDNCGDPVNCFTGLFLEESVDLALPDVQPIELVRVYRQNDLNRRAFGVGANHNLDLDLWSNNNYQELWLRLADGSGLHFVRTSPGTSYTNAVYEHKETPGPWYGTIVRYNSAITGWEVVRRDGTVQRYPQYAPMYEVLDRHGNTIRIQRESADGHSGRILRLISPNGRFIEFSYAAPTCAGCISRATDHSGRFVQYDYDAQGRLVKFTAPENTVVEYTYDSAHRMLTVKDPRANLKLTNEYYSASGNTALDGRVKKQTYADATSMAWQYFFNAANQVEATQITDSRASVTRKEYNAAGYIVKHYSAYGTPEQTLWSYERDAGNLVLRHIDPLGRKTAFVRDAAGNVLSQTALEGSPQATTWQQSWDNRYNQPATFTDPLNRTLSHTYDAQGSLTDSRDALGHQTTRSYHANGQLASVSLHPGTPAPDSVLTTRWDYEFGDLVRSTDALQRSTTYHRDLLGRLIGQRDPAGQLATFFYDALGRLTRRCDPGGACASLAYDANGNLNSFELGSTRRDFAYDTMNRVLSEGRGASVERSFEYDRGLLKKTTEASGRVIDTSHDPLARVKQIKVSLGAIPTRTIDYQWDPASRLLSLADSLAGSLSYTYDDRFDALKTETGPTGTLSYSYHANGLRQSATPSGGSAISYAWDDANRLTSLSQAAGSGSAQPAVAQSVQFGYDNANRRSRLILANGISVDYRWDDASQLGGLSYKLANGTPLGELDYSYDTLGRRTRMGGSLARSSLPPAVALPVGADGRTASEDGATLIHDANGRLTQEAQYKYLWNDLGQLVEVRNQGDNALRASFSYDAAGRRTAKTIDGVSTKYLHDGANPIQLQDAAGTPQENLLAGAVDEWFARTKAGATQHYLTDALGSTLRITDAAGAKLIDYSYDPYGGSSNDNATVVNPFQYTGRENDGLGLYYYRARYYKPKWGRFLAQDPIGLGGGDNLVAYVGGNPVSRIDPTGTVFFVVVPLVYEVSAFVVGVGTAWWITQQVKTPNSGPPGSWHTNPGSGQERLYGPTGQPEVDIDWDHDHGQGQPHPHNWGPGGREVPEGGFSPWPKGRGNPASCPKP